LGAAMTFLLAQGSWAWFESHMIALGHRFTYQANKTPEPTLTVPEKQSAGAAS